MNLDFAKQKIKHSFYFRTQAARHKCHAAYRATMHYVSARKRHGMNATPLRVLSCLKLPLALVSLIRSAIHAEHFFFAEFFL